MATYEEKALAFTVYEILGLRANSTDSLRLFGEDSLKWNRIHRALRKKWKDSPAVYQVISSCFSVLKRRANPTHPFPYPDIRVADGRLEITLDHVSWTALDAQRVALVGENLKKMRDCVLSLPQGAKAFPGIANLTWTMPDLPSEGVFHHCVSINKPRYFYCLDHLLRQSPDLDIRHTAWILTRLYNQACLMEKAHAINLMVAPVSIFINPGSHDLMLLGGWQFASAAGEKALAAPGYLMNLCPDMASGIPRMHHVLQMILSTAWKCTRGVALPPKFDAWLNRPPGEDPVEELRLWNKVKVEAFGPPRFFKWESPLPFVEPTPLP